MNNELEESHNSFDDGNSNENNNYNIYDDYEEILENNIKEKEENEKKKREEEEKNLKETIIFCKKCEFIPEIDLINNQYLYINCKCKRAKNLIFYDFKKEFIDDNKDKKPICKNHKKKYESYCQDCFADKCIQCLEETEPNRNHTLLQYNTDEAKELQTKINDFERKYIESIKNNKSSQDIFSSQGIDDKIIYIIKLILILYKNYPCQNLVYSIKNANLFLTKKINNSEINSIFNMKNTAKEIDESIRYIRKLKQIQVNYLEFITEIDIQEQNFHKLDIFIGLEFPNLTLLRLDENNIEDISPLKYANFCNLDVLSLARNKINDENAKFIGDFHCPNLGVLQLFFNYITKYEIFKVISKFKKLRILFIGNNLFEEITDIDELKDIYDFPNLTKFGATYGVFSDKTIGLISHFKFGKLETLYLQGNNLHNLNSFINIIKETCPDLEDLWLSYNYIDEFESICNISGEFNILKVINLKKNRIKKIGKLKEFIERLPLLNKITLLDNKIDKDNIENKKIIEKVKENKNVVIEI